MARRRRKRYGAVARRGRLYSRRSHPRSMKICVGIQRNQGAGSAAHQYEASAQPCGKGRQGWRYRYGQGTGSTPTSAVNDALRDFAKKVR